MNKTQWLSQMRRGLLEYSILLLIQEKPMYGYDLIAALGQWEVLAVAPGTIYPILKRLQREGVIKSYWVDPQEGLPAKKYYEMTKEGLALLHEMDRQWRTIKEAVSAIRKGQAYVQ